MHGHWTTNRADPIDVDGMVDVHLTSPRCHSNLRDVLYDLMLSML
jgi:hypothetical protein